MQCHRSRPCLRLTTRPDSASLAKCFMIAIREVSNSDAIWPVWLPRTGRTGAGLLVAARPQPQNDPSRGPVEGLR